jgi:hypothetical protein
MTRLPDPLIIGRIRRDEVDIASLRRHVKPARMLTNGGRTFRRGWSTGFGRVVVCLIIWYRDPGIWDFPVL